MGQRTAGERAFFAHPFSLHTQKPKTHPSWPPTSASLSSLALACVCRKGEGGEEGLVWVSLSSPSACVRRRRRFSSIPHPRAALSLPTRPGSPRALQQGPRVEASPLPPLLTTNEAARQALRRSGGAAKPTRGRTAAAPAAGRRMAAARTGDASRACMGVLCVGEGGREVKERKTACELVCWPTEKNEHDTLETISQPSAASHRRPHTPLVRPHTQWMKQ